jgi:hypothetical protein
MGAAQPNSADTTVLTTLDRAVSSTRGSRQHGDALPTQVTTLANLRRGQHQTRRELDLKMDGAQA